MKSFVQIFSIAFFIFIWVIKLPAQKNTTFLRTAVQETQPLKNCATLTVGDWQFWADYRGFLASNTLTGSSGGIFPKGTTSLLYLQGILWGGWLKDAQSGQLINSNPLRVGGVYYTTGVQPGWVQVDGKPVDVNDPRVKIYFIRKDWQAIGEQTLTQEASLYFNVPISAVTEQMKNDLRSALQENWQNWPVDLGAPFNDVNDNGVYDPVLDENGFAQPDLGDYPGIANADQVIWFVVNDLNNGQVYALSKSLPIGLELQITLWTYAGHLTPLSKTVFVRYRLINKSSFLIDSMYVGFFSDPDIGYYGDDVVGCDSTCNMWFAYNGYAVDNEFNKFSLVPPAFGVNLLQGPLVKSTNPEDQAIFDFKKRTGFKNLTLNSFAAFGANPNNTIDPAMGSDGFSVQWYQLFQGYYPSGNLEEKLPWTFGSGRKQGQATRFPLSGDPVNDPTAMFGDIDGYGENNLPGARRMAGNVGPFSMEPGAVQEMILGLSAGMGPDNRQAIMDLKAMNSLLNAFVEKGFKDLQFKPAPPAVKATGLKDKVVLNWGWDEQQIAQTENQQFGDLQFEGYNVYQLPTAQAGLDDPKTVRIATFDVVDGVYTLWGWPYDSLKAKLVYEPIFEGKDSGVKRHLIIEKDYINDQPLYRGSTYYFAVTAYNYNQLYPQFPTFESDPAMVAVTLQDEKPGNRYLAEVNDTLRVQTNMESDVVCKVVVVDPSLTTGHDYVIKFYKDNDTTSTTYGEWLYSVHDSTMNQLLVRGQPVHIFEEQFEAQDERIIDGLAIYVQMPEPGLKAIVEVSNGKGPLPEDQWDELGRPFQGNNVWRDPSAPQDLNRFYLSVGKPLATLKDLTRPLANANGHDFELRFTETGNVFLWWYDEGHLWAEAPFEFYDVGYGTLQDTTDDLRCLTLGYSAGQTPGVLDFANLDPYLRLPASDWIYIRKPINEKGSYQAFVHDVTSGTFNNRWWENSVPVLDGLVICDYGGSGTWPESGTVVRFINKKTPNSKLKFWFTAPQRIENDLTLAQKDVQKINVFPNPYYAGNSLISDRFAQFVTFNHLPSQAIIRIFTLNGALVRKLEKNDPSQFFRWDLKNEKGRLVASGLYIVHIDMPELKKQKTLKLMIIMGE